MALVLLSSVLTWSPCSGWWCWILSRRWITAQTSGPHISTISWGHWSRGGRSLTEAVCEAIITQTVLKSRFQCRLLLMSFDLTTKLHIKTGLTQFRLLELSTGKVLRGNHSLNRFLSLLFSNIANFLITLTLSEFQNHPSLSCWVSLVCTRPWPAAWPTLPCPWRVSPACAGTSPRTTARAGRKPGKDRNHIGSIKILKACW